MAVKGVEKLFNSIDKGKLDYKGHDLTYLMKKVNLKIGKGKVGIKDFIYKSTNVYYFEREFIVSSVLVEGKEKVMEL